MTNQNNQNNPKLDIWGQSLDESKDCFYCENSYYPSRSTAPEDFRSTYCSQDCYEADTLRFKMAAEAEARFSSQVAPENGENYTTTKIGDFILKVRRSESEGNK